MADEPPKKVAKVMAGAAERVGFVGLGAMGGGMAKVLCRSGFEVYAYDVFEPSLEKVVAAGAKKCSSPKEVGAAGISTLVIMAVNAGQAEDVLFGANGAAAPLQKGSAVVLSSTIPPSAARALGARLKDAGLHFVDAPVSGGVVKAGEGTLTIMAGGEDEAMQKAKTVLDAMSAKLFHVGKNPGDGSSMKMVNQLLAGVHIATAAEAMALAARAGLNTRLVYEIITTAAGNSWMFENRVPHMLDDEFLPAKSQLNIFVKDMAIVLGEARDLTFPCPLAATAHQQYLFGAASGYGTLDDASVVKVFESSTGVRVACPKLEVGQVRRWPSLSLASTLSKLPATANHEVLLSQVRQSISSGQTPKLVVLDDDPTGTQTVRQINVLTEWSETSLTKHLQSAAPGFFILTNSRALPTEEAFNLTKEICASVRAAAEKVGVRFTVVLRGDSTLRGHYPAEVDAAAEALGAFDATVICPFFLQGGRYTIDDVHYVASGDNLQPASETEFAKDKAFGYTESHLCDWVQEKTCGKIASSSVHSLSIRELRLEGPEAVCKRILDLPKGAVLIINAAAESDLAAFAAGLLQAEAAGRRVICRTGASFVSARLGIDKAPPVTPAMLPPICTSGAATGGLIMVGSYVAKSSAQVDALVALQGEKLDKLEVNVPELLKEGGIAKLAQSTAEAADALLQKGRDVLVVTSRTLVHGTDSKQSLEIGGKVSECLVELLRKIQTRPRYLLAKGGITSSDLATKGLGAKDALVAGQALPGIPVWILGTASRWQSLPYIVFPGNVGSVNGMADVVAAWASPPTTFAPPWWQH